MMNTEQIRMSKNNLVAVGTLKSNGLIEEQDASGRDIVRGNIVLEIKQDDEINEVEFNCYAAEGSKPYNSIKQAASLTDKVTAIDPSMAARVRVIGGVELNEYVHRTDQEIRSFNRHNAAFIYPGTTDADDIKIELESVITGKEWKDGELVFDLLFADYRGTIQTIKGGAKVQPELAEQADEIYSEGDSAMLTLTVKNSVKTSGANSDTVAFGQVIEETTSETEHIIIGGHVPIDESVGYSAQEKAQMVELRKQQYAQLEASIAPSTGGFGQSNTGGFGSEAENPFL